MANFFYIIKTSFLDFKIMDAVDILVVSFVLYEFIKIMRKTRAEQLLKGIGLFVLFTIVCQFIGITTMSWILQSIVGSAIVFIAVLFQPELRRAFEKVGRGKFFEQMSQQHPEDARIAEKIDAMQRAILNMAKQKVGALIVFERKTGLGDIAESGVKVDADISQQLIENIFFKNSPLHDGAMIIRDNRIAYAGCFLPLSDNNEIDDDLGTRHRASIGISEVSDCIVVVVSEENGYISASNDGRITRNLDSKELKDLLGEAMGHGQSNLRSIVSKKNKAKISKKGNADQ